MSIGSAIGRSLGLLILIVVAAGVLVWAVFFRPDTKEPEVALPTVPETTEMAVLLDEPLTFEELLGLGVLPEGVQPEQVQQGLTLRDLLSLGLIVLNEEGQPQAQRGFTQQDLFDLRVLLLLPEGQQPQPTPTPPVQDTPVTVPTGPLEAVLAMSIIAAAGGGLLIGYCWQLSRAA